MRFNLFFHLATAAEGYKSHEHYSFPKKRKTQFEPTPCVCPTKFLVASTTRNRNRDKVRRKDATRKGVGEKLFPVPLLFSRNLISYSAKECTMNELRPFYVELGTKGRFNRELFSFLFPPRIFMLDTHENLNISRWMEHFSFKVLRLLCAFHLSWKSNYDRGSDVANFRSASWNDVKHAMDLDFGFVRRMKSIDWSIRD